MMNDQERNSEKNIEQYGIIYEQVKLMWNKDCKDLMGLANDGAEGLDKRALETPYLHSKYINYLYDLKTNKARIEAVIKRMRRDLTEYYKGQKDGRSYSKEPFNLKLKVTDIDAYVNSDPTYLIVTKELNMLDNLIEYLKQILTEVGKRSFYINSAITWIKFQHGE